MDASRPASSSSSSRAVLCAAAAGAAAGGLGLLLWRMSRHGEDANAQAASQSTPSPSADTPQPPPSILHHPSFAPIDSVARLLASAGAADAQAETTPPAPSPSPSPAAVVPLPPGAPRTADDLVGRRQGSGPPPLLLCHDMMGGYLPYETAPRGVALPLHENHPPPAPQVQVDPAAAAADPAATQAPSSSPSPRDLAFALLSEGAWSCADLFVYFSHRLVTVPPRGWVSVGHRHGVPVLGTLIVEGSGAAGRRAAAELFGVEEGDDDDDDDEQGQEGGGWGPGAVKAGLASLFGGGAARRAARWAQAAWRAPLAKEDGGSADDKQPPQPQHPPLPPARERPAALAAALARLARLHGFDGWLVNVEVELTRGQARRCLAFVRELRAALEAGLQTSVPASSAAAAEAAAAAAAGAAPPTPTAPTPPGGAFVVWYDAVCTDGRLEWQDGLSKRNAPFLDAAGLLFTNYRWGRGAPARCAELARARGLRPLSPAAAAAEDDAARSSSSNNNTNPRRVLMGVDVYGRGAYGGGGDATHVALAAARAAGVGCALFGVGWTWEHGAHRALVERGLHGPLARRWWSRVRRAWWWQGSGGDDDGGNSNGNNGGGGSSVGSSWGRVSREPSSSSSSGSGSGGGSGFDGPAGAAPVPVPPPPFRRASHPLAWRLPFSTNFNAGAWLRLYPSPPAHASSPSSSSSLLWRGGGAGGSSQAAAAEPSHPGAARPWCDMACQEPLPHGLAASTSSLPALLLDFSDGFDSGSCLRLPVGGSAATAPATAAPAPAPPLRLFELEIEVDGGPGSGAKDVVVRAAFRRGAAATEEQQQQLRRPPSSPRLAVVLWGRRVEAEGGEENRHEEILWTGPAWEAGAQWQAREAVARLAGRGRVVVTALGVAVLAGASAGAAASPPPASSLLLLGHVSLRAPRSPVPVPAALMAP